MMYKCHVQIYSILMNYNRFHRANYFWKMNIWCVCVCVCRFCCMLCNLAFHFIHTNVFYDDGSFHFGIYILSFVFADLFLFSSVAMMAVTTVDVCTNMRIVYVMESTSHLFGCVATLLKTIDNLN